ncbi:hypothetical protein D3C72_2264000 [compost metagenome]
MGSFGVPSGSTPSTWNVETGMGCRSSVMSNSQVKAGGDGRSLATSSSATTRICRPFSSMGIGRAVWVG